MQALTQAFSDIQISTLSLHVPEGASLDKVEAQLGSATHLVVKEPISPSKLKWLSTKIGQVVVLDVTVNMSADVDLTWFSTCTKLKSIALRSLNVTLFYSVYGFSNMNQRPHLESLTVTKANLENRFFSSLQGLPLKDVSLEYSFHDAQNALSNLIKFIDSTPTLATLNVARGSFADKKNLNAIHAKFPLLSLTPQPPTLRQNFNGVLTREKEVKHSYPLATLNNTMWDATALSTFLKDVGGDENSNWSTISFNSSVYRHNVCEELAKASPIQCPDRMRIAAEEPQNIREIIAFLNYAKNLPLIVKVKTPSLGTPPYYPPTKGTKVEFGEGVDKIVVECTDLSKHEVHPITKRTLQIGDKVVHHIQVDWKDGYGIEVDTLSALIELIAELEKDHPGKSLIHCTLGLGRTGTLLACQIIKSLVNSITDIKALSELSLNLEELLRTLRQKRSTMIQHEDQLITILEYTELVVRKRFAA
ncbi:MAG: hypothetical protein LLF94_02780 [Chlamydiales bacterium]|nr:hypothetical protein [Chlamydiales bacterium]